ncbi:MAG: dTDP-4-dehydrorhamnose 3,5-epimerase [Bacteroidota bacterium]|jgi:dTDP-4-dehydrorhamnose 3,5-epimerase|nr:dTDP-4-dehydrorhamnose 3,5-epimerase [Bacteroidota bacterium]
MLIKEAEISGVFIIEPQIFEDSRGYFFESFNQRKFNEAVGKEVLFVQDNQSVSKYGVLRGLHFQKPPYAQAKLVRVINGEVLDVAVDIRNESPTFGKYISIILSGENKRQLYIPQGFAHGFIVLSETAEFFYKCDNFYAPSYDSGIVYNDKDLEIDWRLPSKDIVLSEKDRNLPTFSSLQQYNF